MNNTYIPLGNLRVYQLSRELSKEVWLYYSRFNYHQQKIIGDQFLRSVDSIGANIAEGYGRFHYLDRVRFYYNARGSLFEVQHWLELLRERQLLDVSKYEVWLQVLEDTGKCLNTLISQVKNLK